MRTNLNLDMFEGMYVLRNDLSSIPFVTMSIVLSMQVFVAIVTVVALGIVMPSLIVIVVNHLCYAQLL